MVEVLVKTAAHPEGVLACRAETAFERMRGLIGTRDLPAGSGMLIPKCCCIHTLFMQYPIDAEFLDAEGRTVKVVRGIRPGRLFIWGGFHARQVLETKGT